MSAALTSLLRQSSIDDHDEVLKQCNEDLKQNRNDTVAQHAKAIALLQLNRFQDAVGVFEQGGTQLKDQAALEYAYALYKAGDVTKAKEVVEGIDSREGKLLDAQISYRLEDFINSAKVYESLAKDPQGEENDLRINLNATYAQLIWKRQGNSVKKIKAEREDLEGFETAYNAACMSIARGDLGQAEVLVRRAKDLCNAAEELSSEQRQEEILSITVQQLYILHALGKTEEAKKIAEQIAGKEIPDASTSYIGLINKLAGSGVNNPYLAQRHLESAPTLPPNDKLFGFQEFLVRKNDLALDFSCSKLEGIKRSTMKEINSVPSPSADPKLIIASAANAAAHAQSQLGKQGLKAILPLVEKRPHDIGLIITIVQLYVLSGNNGAAIHVIEKFFSRLDEIKSANKQEVRFNPGLVAILISLYSIEGRKSHIRDELATAASYWQTTQNPPTGLLRAAGVSMLEQGHTEDIETAGEIFKILHNIRPDDRIAKAGLAASTSKSTSSQSQDTTSLTSIDRLVAGVDVPALEQAGIPRSTQSTAAILKRKRVDPSSTKPHKKRIRKSKLPKDYDPNKKSDPERWLPLRDRSNYRPKGRKGKQKQSAATQGSSEKPAESNVAQEKSTVATGSSTGGKAKKKKGKR